MFYYLTIRNDNGETITAENITAAFLFTADNKPQNSVYATAAEIVKNTPTAAAFRVYPCNDTANALHVATAAARAAANRGGKAAETEHAHGETMPTEKAAAEKAAARAHKQTTAARHNATQETIYADLRRISAGTAAALAKEGTTATWETAENYIFSALPTAAAETQDFFSVALLATCETCGNPAEKAAAAFRAVNAFTRGEKSRNEKETSTEYIIDGGGDLVTWGTAAAAILHGGERWTPTAAATMDTETAAMLGETLAAAFLLLSPVQRDIVRRIVNGYSVRQVAAAMKREIRTTQRNIESIRRIFAAYIEKNAPVFSSIIADSVRAAEQAAERKAAINKKAAAARRAREKAGIAYGKTAAERMKEYRARKKAEQAAETAAERAAKQAERETLVTAATAAANTLPDGKIMPLPPEFIR